MRVEISFKGRSNMLHQFLGNKRLLEPAGCRSWYVARFVRLRYRIRPQTKSVDFHDAENRQRSCRVIMRHIKDLFGMVPV
ncbi:hypothetical protein TNCV_2293291 [Trichonephila clavipes]|nr:hypothetical protein TNCV_2293291 [Trichonephila clavipes]